MSAFKTSTLCIALALAAGGGVLGCHPLGKRASQDAYSKEQVMERAKEAALQFLMDAANQRGSLETYTFIAGAEENGEIILSYQGRLPDFYVYTHSIVTVAYDPNSDQVRLIGRRSS